MSAYELIEKCFTVLDMDYIELMFELYPRKQIMKVWREQICEYILHKLKE